MKKSHSLILAAGLAASFAAAANAQETIDFLALNGGVPINSGGNIGTSSASTRLTSMVNFNYTFANSFMWGGSITINGTLRQVTAGNFASEARVLISSPLNGTSASPDAQLFTTTSFTGSVMGTRTMSLSGFTGVPFNVGGQTFNFRFYESFNDSGTATDAEWDALTITFNAFVPPTPPACTDLGTISNGNYPAVQTGAIASGQTVWYCFDVAPGTNPLDIFTHGSVGTGGAAGSLDTELGLYNSLGQLVATNDDIGGVSGFGNFGSRITVGGGSGTDVNGEAAGGTGLGTSVASLAAGRYYLALSTFNSTFANDFGVTPGTNSGEFRLTIIPTPGAAALLGLSALAGFRRRRA
ncbi:MAG: hypothetical protein JNK35_12420 [Phycisphaerae bacterium]|nr:hypothetical protein [Phycisphaerae bacterium]